MALVSLVILRIWNKNQMEIFMLMDGKKIICNLSIIGIYGIRLLTKTMLTKVICVRQRI